MDLADIAARRAPQGRRPPEGIPAAQPPPDHGLQPHLSAAGTPAQGTGMRWRRSSGWRPGELGWRVAWLFMVGSTLFALGSFPLYAQFVDGRIVGITFVVGSIFFTAAGYSQFLQVINDPPAPGSRFRLFAWQPQRMLWWAVAIQLVGTLFFNVDTVDALIQGLTAQRENRLVWAPDFFGSIAFLVASHLAWLDVCGGTFWRARTDNADWWSSGAQLPRFDLLHGVGDRLVHAADHRRDAEPDTGELRNLRRGAVLPVRRVPAAPGPRPCPTELRAVNRCGWPAARAAGCGTGSARPTRSATPT